MNKYFRKHSFKIYRSPRLLRYPIPDDPEPAKIQKEVQTQSKKYNINIVKVEPEKMSNEIQQQKIDDSTSTTNKRYKSQEEKKIVKTSLSKKNSMKSNNKEEIALKPLKRNNSNANANPTVKESQRQNIKTNIKNQQLIPSGYNKNTTNKTIDNKNTNESAYIDRRRTNNEMEKKNENRPRSQAKPQSSKIEPQNKYIPKQQKVNNDLKQSQSQTKIKISSNDPNFKMRQIPIPKITNDRRTPKPMERKNTGHVSSNTTRINSKVYQDKDNNKTFNTSSNSGNYTQRTQKSSIPTPQNKNYRNEYKPPLQPQQINAGKNMKNNNQTYYSSQSGQRQEQSNLQRKNVIVSGGNNKYNTINKDNKPKVNYDMNKNHNIYESKNVNKENYDKNRSGYSYVVNISNTKSSGTGNKSIDVSKSQRRLVVNN